MTRTESQTGTATFTQEGWLSVDGQSLGFYDADGGEWVEPVDQQLRLAGWERVGDWVGDDAPVREL